MSIPIALPEPVTLTRAQRAAARVSVAAARLLIAGTRRRPTLLHRLLRAAGRWTRRPASLAEATRVDQAVTGVSLRCASAHGCLPRSVAITIWCLAARRRVRWVTGTSTGPVTVHAWVEVDGGRGQQQGQAVGEPTDPHLLYQPIITI